VKNEDYTRLFELALKGEGKLLKGFSNFWNYSFQNQILAIEQMHVQGLQIGPIASFKKWNELGRKVKKGSKALWLYMPAQVEDKNYNDGRKKLIFLPRKNWFCMAQTEGEDVVFPEIGFNFEKAFETLKITREEFSITDGNTLGYARRGRILSVNPLNSVGGDVASVTFHEMGHILLGHTDESDFVDEVTTQKNLKEVEAEGVALCCKLALGLENVEYSVGYINNWWKQSEIPATSIKKIFRVTNEILKAGQEKPEDKLALAA
jgi:hypothetical protein